MSGVKTKVRRAPEVMTIEIHYDDRTAAGAEVRTAGDLVDVTFAGAPGRLAPEVRTALLDALFTSDEVMRSRVMRAVVT